MVFDGLAKGSEQLGFVEPGDLGQQPVWTPLRPATEAVRSSRCASALSESTRLSSTSSSDGGRSAGSPPRGPRLRAPRPGRRCRRSGRRPGRHAGRGVRAQDRGKLGGDLVAAEPEQLDADHGRSRSQAGEQRAQRVAAVQFVGPVGDHQQDPGRAQRPDQEGGQVQGGLVGPVQVLDSTSMTGRTSLSRPSTPRTSSSSWAFCGVVAGRSRRLGPGRARAAAGPGPARPGRATRPASSAAWRGPACAARPPAARAAGPRRRARCSARAGR